MQNPLNKVVFIQKIAAFSSRSFSQIIRLNFVNSSWADTIQNYSFHLFDKLAFDQSKNSCDKVLRCALSCDLITMWLLNCLLSSITFLNRINCLLIACAKRSTPFEIIKFTLDKIEEVGGAEVLVAQITATDKSGKTCLMTLCKTSPSRKVVKLMMEKIEKVGGADLVKAQLSATDDRDYGRNCMMFVCCNKSLLSTEMVQFIFDKSAEAGGLDLIKYQLTATDHERWDSIMHLCFNNWARSSEVLQLVSQKILEIGGPDLFRRQLTVKKDDRGNNCFMILCRYSSSSNFEKIKSFCDKCVELCGSEALKNLLSAVDRDERNALMEMCSSSSVNASVIGFIFIKCVQVGGLEFLKQQLTAMDAYRRSCFQICVDVSSSTSSVLRLIASLLHQLHVDLFRSQYAKMNSHQQKILKEKANIKNDSWIPDAERIAEVKRIIASGGE